MRMTLRRVTSALPEYKKVKTLYHDAFPPEERPPFFMLTAKTGSDNVDFWAIYADNKWVGLAYIISRDKLSYLFYLAVSDTERGKGYGSAIIRTLRRMYDGQQFFLALETLDKNAENYDERVKRRNFYMHNGLVPVDCRITEGGVTYDVMGTSPHLDTNGYIQMMNRYAGPIFSRIYPYEISQTERTAE